MKADAGQRPQARRPASDKQGEADMPVPWSKKPGPAPWLANLGHGLWQISASDRTSGAVELAYMRRSVDGRLPGIPLVVGCFSGEAEAMLAAEIYEGSHRQFRVRPRFWCSWMVPLGLAGVLASRGGENTAAQQVVAGASIHGPLQQLQPVDLSLDGTCAPRLGKGGPHRVAIAFGAARKRAERRPVNRVRRAADERGEAGGELAGPGEIGAVSAKWARNTPSCSSSLPDRAVSNWAQRRLDGSGARRRGRPPRAGAAPSC